MPLWVGVDEVLRRLSFFPRRSSLSGSLSQLRESLCYFLLCWKLPTLPFSITRSLCPRSPGNSLITPAGGLPWRPPHAEVAVGPALPTSCQVEGRLCLETPASFLSPPSALPCKAGAPGGEAGRASWLPFRTPLSLCPRMAPFCPGLGKVPTLMVLCI